MLLFPNFLFFYFKANFKSILNSFRILDSTTHYNKSNAPACMHNNIAKPYDKFYNNENYYFPMFHEHKNTKLNQFNYISKRRKN